MTSNKNLWIGVLALLVIIASVFIVIAKSTFEVQPAPQEKKEVGVSEKEGEKTKQVTEEEKLTGVEKEVKKTYETSPVPEETHTALQAPTEPAYEPKDEDIFQIAADDGACEPKAMNLGDKTSIILEVEAKDASYNFNIVDLPISEVIERGKTKKISFPRPSNFNKLEFECIRGTK